MPRLYPVFTAALLLGATLKRGVEVEATHEDVSTGDLERGYRTKEDFEMVLVNGCSNGDVDAVKLAVKNGISVLLQNEMGTPVFHAAAERGHVKLLKYLIEDADKKVDPNYADAYGKTAIMKAAEAGQYNVVDYLSSLPNVNAADQVELRYGHTALSLAMMQKHHDVARLLCERTTTHVRPIISLISDWVDGPYTLDACMDQYSQS